MIPALLLVPVCGFQLPPDQVVVVPAARLSVVELTETVLDAVIAGPVKVVAPPVKVTLLSVVGPAAESVAEPDLPPPSPSLVTRVSVRFFSRFSVPPENVTSAGLIVPAVAGIDRTPESSLRWPAPTIDPAAASVKLLTTDITVPVSRSNTPSLGTSVLSVPNTNVPASRFNVPSLSKTTLSVNAPDDVVRLIVAPSRLLKKLVLPWL